MRTIATFMRAFGAAKRTSAARASAKPPPVAAPCTRQMIGCGQRRIRRKISVPPRRARPTGPSRDDVPGRVPRGEPAEVLLKLVTHATVHRVESLRPVEREPID